MLVYIGTRVALCAKGEIHKSLTGVFRNEDEVHGWFQGRRGKVATIASSLMRINGKRTIDVSLLWRFEQRRMNYIARFTVQFRQFHQAFGAQTDEVAILNRALNLATWFESVK